MITFAHDASFGGWGIAICDADGPIAVEHLSIGTKTHRWQALARAFETTIANMAADAEAIALDRGCPVRLVVERCPDVMGGGFAKKPKRNPWSKDKAPRSGEGVGSANPTLTAFGLGLIVGPLMLFGYREGWLYPWDRRPDEWRREAGIKGRGRAEKKRHAVELARWRGWTVVDRYPTNNRPDLGPRADVAEAIHLGVSSARDVPRSGRSAPPAGPAKPDPYRLTVARRHRSG